MFPGSLWERLTRSHKLLSSQRAYPMPRVNAIAPVITGDVYRMLLNYKFNGQQMFFGMDYMASNSAGNPRVPLAALPGIWWAAVAMPLAAVFAGDVTFEALYAACISRSDIPTIISTALAGTTTGSVVGGSLPSVMAAVMSKGSDLKGQHGRGRLMVGPPAASFVNTVGGDPDVLTAPALAFYATLATALMGPFALPGQTAKPCISTRPLQPDTTVKNAAEVTSIVTQPLLGTIRRRREGRGI